MGCLIEFRQQRQQINHSKATDRPIASGAQYNIDRGRPSRDFSLADSNPQA